MSNNPPLAWCTDALKARFEIREVLAKLRFGVIVEEVAVPHPVAVALLSGHGGRVPPLWFRAEETQIVIRFVSQRVI